MARNNDDGAELTAQHPDGADLADQDALLRQVGLARPSVPASAESVLRELVDTTIKTITGRPNTILRIDGGDVIVRTTRSEEGEPVPIEAVQEGIDLLFIHGTVRVNPETLGHRSSFVGAVLAMLPDAELVPDPARVLLRSWPEDDISLEHEPDPDVDLPGRLDRTAQVKVRREQAGLRRIALDRRDQAPCALCGYEYPADLLVAAHVKKRSECTDAEMRKARHVVMLACHFGCDRLYESGRITVAANGAIQTVPLADLPSGRLRDQLAELSGRHCLAHDAKSEPFFGWHRTNTFTG